MAENAAPQVLFFAYFDCKPQFDFPQESYGHTVLFCLKSGAFRYKIGNGPWYVAKENAIVLCPPGVPFFREALGPVSLLMAKLDASACVLPEAPVYCTDPRVQSDIAHLTEKGFAFTYNPEEKICHYVRDLWYAATENPGNGRRPLQEVYDYICSHFCEDISINELAQKYGYTAPRLIALFNKHYGAPPKNIILRNRIIKAQGLLLQTDLSVGEISLACGYEDTLYFSRIFSKYCGCSPSQFRKQETI
ncbi:MAG: helix-turn-helix transcriptional regulator [Oscillospiraceae bacterium]|nr:helix-turn-helix transcriptional regulator [Oscillospiraceae bacterium]